MCGIVPLYVAYGFALVCVVLWRYIVCTVVIPPNARCAYAMMLIVLSLAELFFFPRVMRDERLACGHSVPLVLSLITALHASRVAYRPFDVYSCVVACAVCASAHGVHCPPPQCRALRECRLYLCLFVSCGCSLLFISVVLCSGYFGSHRG